MDRQVKRPSLLHLFFEKLLQRKPHNTQSSLQEQISLPKRPNNDDRDSWRDYWQQMGQPWRTEQEIDLKRQQFLSERRAIVPNIEKGIYPFKDVKLYRADVEWLLATHEQGRGPIDWSDESQREHKGLDLRGAILIGENLQELPLTRLRAGLDWGEGSNLTLDQIKQAATHFEHADLRDTHLEDAILCYTHFEHARLSYAYVNKANMVGVRLVNATLINTCLQEADLSEARCEDAYFLGADAKKTCLREVYFDATSNITGFKLDAETLLTDVHWGDVNLAVIDWSPVIILGDEHKARKSHRIEDYHAAVRANRQLAVALQAQGLNEVATRFAYRANILQKKTLWLQMHQPKITLTQRLRLLGSWLFSWFLHLLAGYGYRPWRSIVAYLLMISIFAAAYFVLGLTGTHHLQWYEALVVSLTAFHGRGFFSEQFQPGDPQAIIAAIEAVVGLVIEISFIATFTQRFFGK